MFSSRERGKKLKFQQLEHFYLPFRMLQNAFQRTNFFNTYQRQERISREEPTPNPTRKSAMLKVGVLPL